MRSNVYFRTLLFSFFFTVCLAPSAATADTEAPYTYTINNEQATITGFDTLYAGDLSITNELGGYPVTEIGFHAFRNCALLTTITMPTNIIVIGWGAFAGCFRLIEINVDPNNTAFMSEDGILYDKSQTTLMQCPSAKTGSITIPASVSSIAWGAFKGCTELVSIHFKGNAPSLGADELSDLPEDMVIYYQSRTSGWGETFGGFPTILVRPLLEIEQDAAFGFTPDHFGFTIFGPANTAVVVETCIELSCGVWTPFATNTLDSAGSFYFSDPASANIPARFYRVSLP